MQICEDPSDVLTRAIPVDRAAPARALLWAFPFLILTLLLMVPFTPAVDFSAGLDPSYRLAYHYAFVHGLRIGTDMIGTYGPWGFTEGNLFHPRTFGWTVVIRALIATGLFTGLWAVGERLRVHPLARGLWVLAIVVTGDLFFFDDGLISAMCFLPALLRHTSRDARDPWQNRLLVAALAVAALTKFTFLALGGAVLVVLTLEDLYRRRFPVLAACYAATLLAFWRIAGQPFGVLPVWAYNALNMAGGYSAAMGHPADDFYMIPVVVALACAVTLALLAFLWRKDRTGALVVAAAAALALFMCYKEGFVRHDGHEAAATTGLLAVTLMLLPFLWSRRPRPWAFGIVATALVAASVYGVTQTSARFAPSWTLGHQLAHLPQTVGTRAVNAGKWAWYGNDLWAPAHREADAAIRAKFPLPHVHGTVDMYGLNQGAIFAAGMDYRPRPLAPGYHAWTPRLLHLNAASLAGPRAPDHAFFTIDPIDYHYPSLADGPLWPELLSRYDLAGFAGDRWLVLDRAPHPRPIVFTPVSSNLYPFGQEIPVPQLPSGSVWTKIEMTPTLFGRLGSTLYRSAEVYLTVKTADGRQFEHRIIPAVAAAGFVLSPYITDAGGFAALLAHRQFPPDVTSITVRVTQTAWPGRWFDPNVRVTFQRLDVQTQDLGNLPAVEARANLAYMSRTNAKNFIDMTFFNAPDGTSALFAHAPTHMLLPAPEHADRRRLHFGYGIKDGAWDKTEGIVFRVTSVNADSSTTVLWTNTLDPQRRPGDRRHVTADIDVPPGVQHLVFETLGVTHVLYGWSYWSDVRFR